MTTPSQLPSTQVPAQPYRRPTPVRSDALRLDGNEGAVPSLEILAAVASLDVAALRDYPNAGTLEEEIAVDLGVDPRRVVVTAGADDALDRLCRAYLRAGRQMVLPIPTFEMLYRFAAIAGGEVVTVPWNERYPVDEVIASIGDATALVAVVSPNNPTGQTVTAEELDRVAAAAPNAIVLLDHVYVEYADEDLTSTALRHDNVVVVRTFSKAWGLAGCRVGYAVASAAVAGVLRNAGNPYPVSALAVAAVREQRRRGREALNTHVTLIRQERARLATTVEELGLAAPPSQGNFLLVDAGPRVAFVYDALAALGITVRFFPHRPEIATQLRITLPGREDYFHRLTSALAACQRPEALLFDMDGVLADVEESYRRCCIETARAFGVAITRDELAAAVHAGNANNDWELTRRLLRERGVEASLDEVTGTYQDLYLGSPSTPGLRENERLLVPRSTLERLSQRSTLGIVTGRPRDEAAWFLDRVGIADLFQTVVALEDGPLKPDPSPVETALERLAVSRAWMIGDTPDDIEAALGAGVLPIGVVAPGDEAARATASLRSAGAATVLDDITTLEDLIP